KKMIDETGCDYIMIGRGAMGNPFLFEQINDYLKTGTYTEYSQKNRTEMFCKYLDYATQYKIKFTNIRQQAMRFTKGLRHGAKFRSGIMLAKTTDDLKSIMLQIT
ncbi:MAG: tRNA-dihydrouridine synthase, partial [Candidatus Nitrosotenuis sp.]